MITQRLKLFPETLGTISYRVQNCTANLGGISVNALFWFQWAVVIIELISVWLMYSTVGTGSILAVQMEKEKYV